ncbi:MAG: WG repeat-containing protein [Magnetococcales bacterium]|nr:WG repeat-containing protein [Magnetococcales bacterium]
MAKTGSGHSIPVVHGRVTWPPEFTPDFFCDRALISMNGRFGYMDLEGRVVLDFIFDDANHFSNGSAQVNDQGDCHSTLIDPNGNRLLDPGLTMDSDFNEGLARVATRDFSDRKYGVVNRRGQLVVSLRTCRIRAFSEGMAVTVENDRHGFIDRSGRQVVDHLYADAMAFSEGRAGVKDPVSGKWGFIDQEGNVVIDFLYGFPEQSFRDGCVFVTRGGQGGCIDRDGTVLINFSEEFDDDQYHDLIRKRREAGTAGDGDDAILNGGGD